MEFYSQGVVAGLQPWGILAPPLAVVPIVSCIFALVFIAPLCLVLLCMPLCIDVFAATDIMPLPCMQLSSDLDLHIGYCFAAAIPAPAAISTAAQITLVRNFLILVSIVVSQ
jgi:hypothetical protein